MVLKALPRVVTQFGSAKFHADPYASYAAWRRDTPVFRNEEGGVYLTRHADCARLLGQREFRRRPPHDDSHPFGAASRTPLDVMISHWMLFMDPPRHDAVRAAFAPVFSTAAIERREPGIRAIVQRLIGGLREAGRTELVGAFASPLPLLALCELLGLPEGDRPLFEQWSSELTQALESGTAEQMRAAIPASLAMRDYFARFAGSPFPGLTAEEMIYGCAFLVWAGHETTRNLIAGGVLALCENPAQMALLRRQPELVPSAVEELLRYTAPVQKLSRWTAAASPFGEYEVPGGTLVTALIGAANRDPAAFDDPHRLNLQRAGNRHLSFGRGLHACLGAPLARLEARIAFAALAGELEAIEVIDYRWRPNSALRGLESLYIALR